MTDNVEEGTLPGRSIEIFYCVEWIVGDCKFGHCLASVPKFQNTTTTNDEIASTPNSTVNSSIALPIATRNIRLFIERTTEGGKY